LLKMVVQKEESESGYDEAERGEWEKDYAGGQAARAIGEGVRKEDMGRRKSEGRRWSNQELNPMFSLKKGKGDKGNRGGQNRDIAFKRKTALE